MYAVGSRVGTYIAQSVYTVSGPFHPFGGAVDIIVVQQEDGTFKSSPWYVKFGKFQGVLKRREKSVAVAVNDGDASFHMYLDHKGEAYFLKDAQGDEAAAFTEAASSGDESSSHMLALEYPKGEEGADGRAEHGKEESEDERGDDLELRFEGREASKQLIQQSVEEQQTTALAGEANNGAQGSFLSDLEPQESSGDAGPSFNQEAPGTRTEKSEKRSKVRWSNGKVVRALMHEAVGLEMAQRSKPARALLANAALAVPKVSSLPDGTSPEPSSTEIRETASRNGMIVHGLLNQAVGLPPSHQSGPAINLVASAALASLRRVVSDPQSDVSSNISHSQPRFVELAENDLDLDKNQECTVHSSPEEWVGEPMAQILLSDSVSSPKAIESLSNGNSYDDVGAIKLVSSLGTFSTESGVDEIQSRPASPIRSSEVLNGTAELEVTKVEILEETLVVEVQEHVEKDVDGSMESKEKDLPSKTRDIVESFVINRKELMDKVHDQQDFLGQDEPGGVIASNNQKLAAVHEQDIVPAEAGDLEVSVHVDKLLVESLNTALSQDNVESPKIILADEKGTSTADEVVPQISSETAKDGRSEITTAGKERPIPAKEAALLGSESAKYGCSQEIVNAGKGALAVGNEASLIRSEDVKDICTPVVTTAGAELAVVSPVNLTEVSSPRLKAAIEVEMAWRDVMEKAATTVKGAPYMSKKLNHSQSYKKKGRIISENGQKPDGLTGLPEQSERKSWGGWFWGGSSAPQSKQTVEQNSSKEPKKLSSELSMEPRVLDLGSAELRDQSGVVTESEDVANRRTDAKQGMVHFEGSDVNAEAEGIGARSESDSGPTEDRKAGSEEFILKGKMEDQSELSDSKSQQKAQGGPPARRRSLFGLLSRSNTNQSSLSSTSSLQSNDDLQSSDDGLKKETSVERADSLVDLFDASWEKGPDARRSPIAIARVPADWITIEEPHSKVEIESFKAKHGGAASMQFEGVNTLLVVKDPEECLNVSVDAHHASVSGMEIITLAEMENKLGRKRGENLNASVPKCDHITSSVRETEAEDIGDRQPEVTTYGLDKNNTLTPVVSDTGPSQFSSTTITDVVLMSVDGHLVTAPLLDNEGPQGSHQGHEKVCDESEGIKRIMVSPSGPVICLADTLVGRPGIRSATPHLPSNGVPLMQQGEGVGYSEQALKEMDRHKLHDSIACIAAGPGYEGLKGLAKLIVFDDVGTSEPKIRSSYAQDIDGLSSENAQGELGPTSENGPSIELNGDDQGSTDTIDSKEIAEIQFMAFEKLEQDDRNALGLNQEGSHQYYHSNDLTEVEDDQERKAFKQNMSIYMDHIIGEDEPKNTGSSHEDGLEQSRDISSPIGIPGPSERSRSFQPSNNMHIKRTASESLPNARRHMVHSEMTSPRIALSRSLDSAPFCTILPSQRREQSASSDGVLPAKCEEEDVTVAERTTEKVEGESQQVSNGIYDPSAHSTTAGTTSSTTDDRGNGPETGFELSLCGHLLMERMGLEAAAQAFATEKVTLDEFKKSGSAIAANVKLIARVGGRYYPWAVAAPIVLGILAFGQVLIAPNEGAIPVEQPIVVFDGKAAASTPTTLSTGGWKLWPFGGSRRPKTPEKGNIDTLVSRDALILATEAALKSNLANQYLRIAGYKKRPRKVRTNSPSSQQLASLNLKEGSNKITFTFVTRMLGKQQVDARIYLWKWNTRIVISDVDGTITKSDVLGQFMPLVGKDWTQSGVARLFSAIKKNGYELLFLSARAISQAYLTRQFLENIRQDGEVLPDGPVVISPDGLFPSLYREVIRRAPHEFKIACLEDIKSLFPPESKPFYAGFGNRDTDELSYLKVGISRGKIFIINPKGEVVVNNHVDMKSYTSLHKLVDDMFPAMTFTEQEDYNEWNFWKLPLPDIDDELSVKSSGSSSSRRVVKSGRHS